MAAMNANRSASASARGGGGGGGGVGKEDAQTAGHSGKLVGHIRAFNSHRYLLTHSLTYLLAYIHR